MQGHLQAELVRPSYTARTNKKHILVVCGSSMSCVVSSLTARFIESVKASICALLNMCITNTHFWIVFVMCIWPIFSMWICLSCQDCVLQLKSSVSVCCSVCFVLTTLIYLRLYFALPNFILFKYILFMSFYFTPFFPALFYSIPFCSIRLNSTFTLFYCNILYFLSYCTAACVAPVYFALLCVILLRSTLLHSAVPHTPLNTTNPKALVFFTRMRTSTIVNSHNQHHLDSCCSGITPAQHTGGSGFALGSSPSNSIAHFRACSSVKVFDFHKHVQVIDWECETQTSRRFHTVCFLYIILFV